MRIGIDQLKRGVYQVGRALLTPHPTYANGALATSFAIENERRRQGEPLLDVWFEVSDQIGKHYIIEKSDGSGEYLREFPPNVPQENVVKTVVPKGASPASSLLDQIEGLLKRFQQTTHFLDEPTNEVLELENGASAQKEIETLLPLVSNIRLATDPNYNERITSQLTGQLEDVVLRCAGPGGFSQVETSVSVARKTTETMRVSLLADCTLTAFFMVFHDLCTMMFKYRIESGVPEKSAQDEFLHRIVDIRQASRSDPLHLLGFSLGRALRDGGREVVIDLAHRYLEKGHDLIDEALDARTRHSHGDALYRAAVFLFSARRLFGTLLESAPRLPGLNVEEMRKLSNASEEDTVKVQDALLFALRNRGDELLDVQRERFRVLAMQKGSSAVKPKVIELVEQKFYYPRIFGGYFQGGEKPGEE